MRASEVRAVEQAFGGQVRAVRRAAGLTQAEVARLASVSRGAVGSLEAGTGSSLDTIVRVLGVLGRTEWLQSLEVVEEPFNPLDLLGGDR